MIPEGTLYVPLAPTEEGLMRLTARPRREHPGPPYRRLAQGLAVMAMAGFAVTVPTFIGGAVVLEAAHCSDRLSQAFS